MSAIDDYKDCRRKRAYLTIDEAGRAAREIAKRQREELVVYRCVVRDCGKYHVGHPNWKTFNVVYRVEGKVSETKIDLSGFEELGEAAVLKMAEELSADGIAVKSVVLEKDVEGSGVLSCEFKIEAA